MSRLVRQRLPFCFAFNSQLFGENCAASINSVATVEIESADVRYRCVQQSSNDGLLSQARSCSGQLKTPVPKSRHVDNWTLLLTSRSARRIPEFLRGFHAGRRTILARPVLLLRHGLGAIPTAPYGLSRVLGQARKSREKAPISVSQRMALHCYEELRK